MFHSPWWFAATIIIPLLIWLLFFGQRKIALSFSSTAIAAKLTPTLRQRLLWLPKLLTIATVIFLIVGLAQPREGTEQVIVDSEGIAIEMLVDCSGSMQALDFKIDGERVDRLTAVKNVAAKFITGDDDLDGRLSDLVGLISFAGFADALTPPTLDHAFLVESLDRTNINRRPEEQGTAIGDAIALAVEKLNLLDERQSEEVASKIIILLTDGENTAGEVEPLVAAELAQSLGIKIYTIGVGTKGAALFPVRSAFGTSLRRITVNIDEDTLTKVAGKTGGQYFRATDTDSLKNIYAEIDQLEKSKVNVESFVNYRELAIQSWQLPYLRLPPFLSLAMGCLMLRVVLSQTWLKELSQ